MWKLYDQLIAAMPEKEYITEIVQTSHWTLVENSQHVIGSAMRFSQDSTYSYQSSIGKTLKETAKFIKSWDLQEASVGLAAINSFFNQSEQIAKFFSKQQITEQDTFYEIPSLCSRYKVAMIGHFPYVDRYPSVRERLFIFELTPRPGDYPASAAEFLLPEMDYVFITASALVNKTLPRLLTLAQKATVIVTGSSCPLSPLLFEFGVDRIGGTIYSEPIHSLIAKKETQKLHLSNCGKQIQIYRKGKNNE